jgi:hypothetical protein
MKLLGSMLVLSALLLSSVGCGRGKDDRQAKAKAVKDSEKSESKHDGWWCEEHGVPEELCSLCSDALAAKFKKEGDWCKEHDRAQSQCFKCDPAKYAKFEAMYEAKYGKKPPRPPESEFTK